MGRQFQIYLLPEDAIALVEMLQGSVGVHLLAAHYERPEPSEIHSPIVAEGVFTRAHCFLRPTFPVSIKMGHAETQGYWYVDTLFSEVIDFNACYFDQKTIKRGRFYYQPGFYDAEGKWQEKAADFLKWAESVFRVAKKFLKRDPDLSAYVGPQAESWRATGGVFIDLAIKGRPPIIAK